MSRSSRRRTAICRAALDDAECADFETRLVRDPQLLRELEAIARFKVGLQVLDERGELEAGDTRPALVLPAGLRWPRPLRCWPIGGADLPQLRTPPSERSMLAAVPAALTDRQGNVLPSAGTFTVLRKRVTTADAVIELPTPGRAIEVRVLPESAAVSGRISRVPVAAASWQRCEEAGLGNARYAGGGRLPRRLHGHDRPHARRVSSRRIPHRRGRQARPRGCFSNQHESRTQLMRAYRSRTGASGPRLATDSNHGAQPRACEDEEPQILAHPDSLRRGCLRGVRLHRG